MSTPDVASPSPLTLFSWFNWMPSIPEPELTYAGCSVMLPTPPPRFSFGDSVSKRSNGALGSPSEVLNVVGAIDTPLRGVSMPLRPKYWSVLNTDSRSPPIPLPLV